jgi:hypothetical protein
MKRDFKKNCSLIDYVFFLRYMKAYKYNFSSRYSLSNILFNFFCMFFDDDKLFLLKAFSM